MKAYKYHGAGNDFIILDNRKGNIALERKQIALLCNRRYGIGADGLILFENSTIADFKMVYYNSDGSLANMCGNGGRCVVAFAASQGYNHFYFEAHDGFHSASLLSSSGNESIVRLGMSDVDNISKYSDNALFLDTGVPHLVMFVDNLDKYDVNTNGKFWRYHADFTGGTNVNFVEHIRNKSFNGLYVRTYERGIESEPFACGTGVTASAIAAYTAGVDCFTKEGDGHIKIEIRTLRDLLSVEFIPTNKESFTQIFLTGPATLVFEAHISAFSED